MGAVANLSDDIIHTWDRLNNLEDMAKEIDPNYKKSDYYFSLDKYLSQNHSVDLKPIIQKLNINYLDDSWSKADWAIVFIASTVGTIADVLINQTKVLKPVENKIKTFLQTNPKVNNLKRQLDTFSNSFRNGDSAPIDFQDFDMAGLKSVHEIYSFGHDPLRFIEGIAQFITGNYRGVDKFGVIIDAKFGSPIENVFFAVISYVAHMLSDFLNAQGLPYPGASLLMQFGDDKVRSKVTAAYRSQLINTRTAIYQGLPCLLISLIIHSYAIYDNYVNTGKINLLIGKNTKYQPMLLLANATVALENISVVTVRTLIGDHNAFFKINWPVVTNTIKHSVKYLVNESKKIQQNQININQLEQKVNSYKYEKKSVEEYMDDLDKEFLEFEKNH